MKCEKCNCEMKRETRKITRYSHEGDSPCRDTENYWHCEKCNYEEIIYPRTNSMGY